MLIIKLFLLLSSTNVVFFQETDYLAALFHFYDSEDEDDDYEMAGYRNYKSTSKIMMSNKTSKTR